jgi:hypothetical protein
MTHARAVAAVDYWGESVAYYDFGSFSMRMCTRRDLDWALHDTQRALFATAGAGAGMLEWRGVYWCALSKPAEGWYLHVTTHGTLNKTLAGPAAWPAHWVVT